MKVINLLFVALLALSFNVSCTGQSTKEANTKLKAKNKVEVFYFHFTRRCVTCESVEKVSKEALASLYGDKVSFKGLNLTEPDGEMKSKELGVSGQTLLIVSGNTKINLTNEGFMNARNNPEKLKQIIKEKIDPLL